MKSARIVETQGSKSKQTAKRWHRRMPVLNNNPFIDLRYRCEQPKRQLLKGKRYRHIDKGANILAVAHCDSVRANSYHYSHTFTPKQKQSGSFGKVYSTALDDRLGANIIMDILPMLGIHCDILLTDDEEIGQSTAQLFARHWVRQERKQYNWIFQFDRRGTDCVTYDYDGMYDSAVQHFDMGVGSFSDICWLESLNCAGMNIGTGYYREHCSDSYANLDETAQQIARFLCFYREFASTYIPPYALDSRMPDYDPWDAELAEYDPNDWTESERQYLDFDNWRI
jgi:hypothetical protein